ncbi:unnamed protein product [Caenorhabditis auriculariae]|uniref:beta-mannosidase n=1 Tax=Caenorhabditis auriculariae TaxID=2777116 RepID=A0A8S1GVD9_9PELO|nr:unnamed protein product [Caenorhabditis auriculariae]
MLRRLLLSCAFLVLLHAQHVIDLNGEWNFTNSGGDYAGIGIVPGDIYSDLHRAKLIEDPLFGDNHIDLKWVARESWTYNKQFDVDRAMLKQYVFLNVEGLDTVASIYLNNHYIFENTNQFRSHFLNITGFLQEKENRLFILFTSPVYYASDSAYYYRYEFHHDVPPNCPPTIYNGECHVNFIRKAQYSFGWDWGPSFPTIGIWKPISIISYETFHFHDFSFNVYPQSTEYLINFDIFLHYSRDVRVNYTIAIEELNFTKTIDKIFPVFGHDMLHVHHIKKTIPMKYETTVGDKVVTKEVEKWWPIGYGAQKQYKVCVSASTGQKKCKKIGFKETFLAEPLVDENSPEKGREFFFKINNQTIFLKGSNWVPVSMFPSQNHTERMKFLMDSAVEAGMNTLRVWGGGFYETEEFYEYASEKGLLIWQDLMFACALYPDDKDFQRSIHEEVYEQLIRLRKHVSIFIWGVNNENEVAIRTHWWHVENYTEEQQVNDYKKMYLEIGSELDRMDSTRPHVLSSPSNGRETILEGGVAKNPGDEKYGDIHYYNELIDLWQDSNFLTPRCATEYGIQSYPLRGTLARWLDESEIFYTSAQMVHRQHHPGGLATNLMMIFSHFPLPSQCRSCSVDFLRTLIKCDYAMSESFMGRLAYYSQIHQAIALKTETLHYRRYRGILNKNGKGKTMCALYWQLNDVWAAPTWSSIDFDLKWKIAHYEAKRFFKNVVVYSMANGFSLQTFIINDQLEALDDVEIRIMMFAWNEGLTPFYDKAYKVALVEGGTVFTLPIKKKINQMSSDFMYVTTLSRNGQIIASPDVLLPNTFFEVDFSLFGNVEISRVKQINSTCYEIRLVSDGLSPVTWLDVKQDFLGYFSDNGFTMFQRYELVYLNLYKPVELEDSDFTVCNLKNCYV